ncbi:MAG: hypothetical protein ABIS51_23555 [Sphingomonas sp.]
MRRLALLVALFAATPAAGQTVVDSDRIDKVAVTLYRDPGRGEGAISPRWPGGYALITETRTITVPAGRSVIRFEGVSEGMLPESAIVTGLPKRINEKNRDAQLLSPASLINAYLKRSVIVTRTDRATGKVRTEAAVVQSGPRGGVLLTTADGVEALGCSGLPESLSYPGVPEGLSAKPTLSVVADSSEAATVTVQLSYLSQGFDWAANYVARVAEDGKTLDLFAWLTVANGGSQGFADAGTQAVAGGIHREAAARLPNGLPHKLTLQCWPMDITSTHPKWNIDRIVAEDIGLFPDTQITESLRRVPGVSMSRFAAAPPPPPPEPPMMAQQEELGDLKLYRIPEPVTIAAQSSKQVAMIDRKGIRFDRIYTADFNGAGYGKSDDSRPAALVLRTENRDTKGLGLPLPAGRVAIFEAAGETRMLVGESNLKDRAIGDEIEFGAGTSSDVRYAITSQVRIRKRAPFTVRVTNARPTPETFELAMPPTGIASTSTALVEHKGRKVWRVIVPANGDASLSLVLKTRG